MKIRTKRAPKGRTYHVRVAAHEADVIDAWAARLEGLYGTRPSGGQVVLYLMRMGMRKKLRRPRR